MYCAHSKAYKSSDYKAPIKADVIIELDAKTTILAWLNADLAENAANKSILMEKCWRINKIVNGTYAEMNAVAENIRHKIFVEQQRKGGPNKIFVPYKVSESIASVNTTFILAPNGNDTFTHSLNDVLFNPQTEWLFINH